MSRPCPFCGDPLSRERTNVTVHRQRGASEAVARWFYTCETCGREYHGYELGETRRLRLVPISTLEHDPWTAVS
jgi:transcriptional regulator NrdR family protein